MSQNKSLSGRTAVVTGASRGLGRGVAEALAARGSRVVAIARHEGPLTAMAREVPGVVTVAGDAADEALAERTFARESPDVVVLCAGAMPVLGPLQEQTWAGFLTNFEVDAKSAFVWLRHALRLPMKRGGHVVVVSSGAALRGSPAARVQPRRRRSLRNRLRGSMADVDALASDLQETRERFLALVAEIRPDLHRYAARMTGSITDGEDIVQETLARAYYSLPELHALPPLRAWLFQIAHNRAIDHLRRYDLRMRRPLDAALDLPEAADNPEDALAHSEAVSAAITEFADLAPIPRSCVILKDVLAHSLDEICGLLALSLPAVKAALHRGREQLRARSTELRDEPPAATPSPDVARYAALFGARDWEGVRAMLAEDVRLDLVSRSQRSGRRAVGGYLSNYDAMPGWRLVPAWLGGREVIAAFRDASSTKPDYFIEVATNDEGLVTSIRDYRYVPYILREAACRFS